MTAPLISYQSPWTRCALSHLVLRDPYPVNTASTPAPDSGGGLPVDPTEVRDDTRDEQPERRGPGRASRHGSRALARLLADQGALDGRTWIARQLREIRADLAADAGGPERLTARERILIDRIAAAVLICSTIEAHVFASEAPITDAGELLPILRKGYTAHVQSLSRMLQALGLRPERAERLPSLNEYLAGGSDATAEGNGASKPERSAAGAVVREEHVAGDGRRDTGHLGDVSAEPEAERAGRCERESTVTTETPTTEATAGRRPSEEDAA